MSSSSTHPCSSQAKFWRINPFNPPNIRYVVVRNERDELKRSMGLSYWSAVVCTAPFLLYVFVY